MSALTVFCIMSVIGAISVALLTFMDYATGTEPTINLKKVGEMKFASSVIANCLAGILTAIVLFGANYVMSHNKPPVKIECDISKDGKHHWKPWELVCNKYNDDGSVGQYRYCNDCGAISTQVVYPVIVRNPKDK